MSPNSGKQFDPVYIVTWNLSAVQPFWAQLKCPQKSALFVLCVYFPCEPTAGTFCEYNAWIEFPLPVIGDSLTVTVASQSLKGGSHIHLSDCSQQLCPLLYKELSLSKVFANMTEFNPQWSSFNESYSKTASSFHRIFLNVLNTWIIVLVLMHIF